MASPVEKGLSERALSLLWQRMSLAAQGLVTRDNQAVEVLYPGRASSQAGPDFRDAIIRTSQGQVIRGDVEIHLRPQEWESHGHHRDPHYNGVVLHVVLWPNEGANSTQESGMLAPVLAFKPIPLSACPSVQGPDPLLELRSLGDEELGRRLDLAGDERFLAKSQGFALELAREEGEEVLYRGIMEALGYANNRKPFLELAHRLPMKTLASLAGEPPSIRLLALKALLLGVAGLLSPSEDQELARIRHRLPSITPLSSSRWHLFRVRPGNHPRRRVSGVAHILERYIQRGLVRGLLPLVLQEAPTYLTRGLSAPPFLGQSRAKDIVVNVVLPFFYAWGEMVRDSCVARSSLQMYYRYPKLSENEITRELARLLFLQGRSPLINSARRHQGLIHLYKALYERWETESNHV